MPSTEKGKAPEARSSVRPLPRPRRPQGVNPVQDHALLRAYLPDRALEVGRAQAVLRDPREANRAAAGAANLVNAHTATASYSAPSRSVIHRP